MNWKSDRWGQYGLGCGNPIAVAGLRGRTVFDLGSGGASIAQTESRLETGCVIGVDMTPEMVLEIMRKKAAITTWSSGWGKSNTCLLPMLRST